MDEFSSRVDAQRHVLQVVNTRPRKEPLFGLSHKAIERWAAVNKLSDDSAIVAHVNDAAGELFFLANHSEDQISPKYISSAQKISHIAATIKAEMNLQ